MYLALGQILGGVLWFWFRNFGIFLFTSKWNHCKMNNYAFSELFNVLSSYSEGLPVTHLHCSKVIFEIKVIPFLSTFCDLAWISYFKKLLVSILILWDLMFHIELPYMNSSEYWGFFPIVAYCSFQFLMIVLHWKV